jgi:hypothetical protein
MSRRKIAIFIRYSFDAAVDSTLLMWMKVGPTQGKKPADEDPL